MKRTRAIRLIGLALIVATLSSCGASNDPLKVEASINGEPLAEAGPGSPAPLDPAEESTLTLDIENLTDDEVNLERVRLEGELLGTNFLNYDVRVRTSLAGGEQTTLEVPLDFFDLERQATGYLRAHIRTYDDDGQRLSSEGFALDIRGSAFSTMAWFAYVLVLLTGAGIAKNLWDVKHGRLPAHRFHRGMRFFMPGLGFGLLLSVAFSVLRIFPLPATGWVPLTLLPALGAFAFGYFATFAGDDEAADPDASLDDAEDDELIADIREGTFGTP